LKERTWSVNLIHRGKISPQTSYVYYCMDKIDQFFGTLFKRTSESNNNGSDYFGEERGIFTGLCKEICWALARTMTESLQEAVCHLMIIYKKNTMFFFHGYESHKNRQCSRDRPFPGCVCLCVKTSLRAKLFKWKWIHMRVHFHSILCCLNR